jgi:hypothetical protein
MTRFMENSTIELYLVSYNEDPDQEEHLYKIKKTLEELDQRDNVPPEFSSRLIELFNSHLTPDLLVISFLQLAQEHAEDLTSPVKIFDDPFEDPVELVTRSPQQGTYTANDPLIKNFVEQINGLIPQIPEGQRQKFRQKLREIDDLPSLASAKAETRRLYSEVFALSNQKGNQKPATQAVAQTKQVNNTQRTVDKGKGKQQSQKQTTKESSSQKSDNILDAISNAVSGVADDIFSMKTLKIVVIPAAVLIILISFFAGKAIIARRNVAPTGEYQTFEMLSTITPAPLPTPIPAANPVAQQNPNNPPTANDVQQAEIQNQLDLNADWITPTLKVLYTMAFVIAVCAWRDRAEHGQEHDAIIAIVSAAMIHWGWTGLGRPIVEWFAMDNNIMDPYIIDVIIQGVAVMWVIVWSILTWAVALTGGRDLTSVAAFLSLTAIIAVQTGNFGALHDAVGIRPEVTLVSAKLWGLYSELKLTERLIFTKWFIGLNAAALFCVFTELLKINSLKSLLFDKMSLKVKPNWWGLVSVVVYFAVYISLKEFAPPVLNPQWAYLISVLVSLVIASIGRTFTPGQSVAVDGNYANLASGWVENLPWDGPLAATLAHIVVIFLIGSA